MDHRDQLPVGAELVGEYLIESVLGAGGFGITYRARDLGLDKLVAIKEYFPGEYAVRDSTMTVGARTGRHSDMYEWGRTRFLEEARTLSRFNHPNIVRVSRVFEALNTAYMVLTFEDGPSLSQWLDGLNKPPTQEQLDRIFSRLLDAVEALHAAEFIHRDIAPDNIIIRADGTPALLDFGAARQAIAAETRTLTGIIKPGYSPPEQYATKASHQGAWTDIYAIGATLYRCVTGARPTDGPDRQLGDELTPARDAGKGQYRASFLDAIDWALDLRPTERPQTIAAFRESLFSDQPVQSLRHSQPTEPRPSFPPAAAATGAEKRWWPAAAATGAVIVLSAIGYFTYLNWAGERTPVDPVPTQRELAQRQAALERDQAAARERRQQELAKAKIEADERAWRRATDSGDLAAFRRYLDEHRGGAHAANAHRRIALLQETARKDREATERRAAEQRRRDDVAWQRALDSGTREGFQRYLRELPGGRFADVARRRIENSKRDAERAATEREQQRKRDVEAWRKADAAATIDAFRKYLRDFPAGQQADTATKRISLLIEAKRKRDLAQRSAREAREARERDDRAWTEARRSNVLEKYRNYLQRFPNGQHRQDARAKITELDVAQRRREEADRRRKEEAARRREEKQRRAQGRIPVAVNQRSGADKVRWLKPGNGRSESFKECRDCPTMVVIPAGKFKLGSPGGETDRDPDEGPRLNVTMSKPFAVGKFEVTFAQWDACVDDGGCNTYKPSDQEWGRERHPVINVSWYDARSYAAWLSKKTGKPYRLLSEAEWEYTARAGTDLAFWWGRALNGRQANFDRSTSRGNAGSSTAPRRTAPVKSFHANGWGLYDVHGNVWEWVADCWYANYSAKFKSDRRAGKPALGSNCKLRVMRGGGWNSPAKSLRSANRAHFVAKNDFFNLGFRIARTIKQ